MTTITKERLQWLANISGRDDIDDIDGGEIRELARIALASLEQNALSGNSPLIPGEVLSAIREVARIRADFDDFDGDRRGIGDCLDEAEQELIVTINKYASQLAVEPVVPAVLERLRTIVADPRALPRRKEWVSGQQYSYVLLENVEAMVDEACHAAMLQGSQPVSQTYNLPELIEGMEVSIDVSTCDADLGNRYFGTVTEALELDTAKNGYILLVQDAEPNFDINGNSPVTPDGLSTVCAEAYQVVGVMADALGVFGDAAVQKVLDNLSQQKLVHRDVLPFSLPVTPDGWISCSERMPEDTKMLLAFSQGEIVAAYWNWVVNPIDYKKYRAFTYLSGNILDDVTHWMPLPEPPQEVNP